MSVADRDEVLRDSRKDGYRVQSFPWDYKQTPVLRGLRWSSGFRQAIGEAALGVDVIHNHGLWLMPNVLAGWSAKEASKPFVLTPRGMLAPAALTFSRRKKRLFWHLLQGSVVRSAACIHATSKQEYEEIRAFGLSNPIAVIPNGIDVPELQDFRAGSLTDRFALSLGRIHPKKGLDRLLRAWAMVEASHPGWRLRIIGPSEDGYDKELRALAGSLGLKRISIEEAIYGDAKLAAYRAADFFVLTTLNENFAISVAEALAAGLPAIVTKGAPWSGLEAEGCGWWIDHGIESLAATLAQAMELPRDALNAMGERGRAWMKRDFSWERVASEMRTVYIWLASRQEPPANVLLN